MYPAQSLCLGTCNSVSTFARSVLPVTVRRTLLVLLSTDFLKGLFPLRPEYGLLLPFQVCYGGGARRLAARA